MRFLQVSLAAVCLVITGVLPAAAAPLTQIGSIALGPVKGAIGALAIDYAHQRLFVLEPDAGSLAVADLDRGSIVQTVTGLAAPRGLARAPTDDRLYVSTGDGKLMVYAGVPLSAESPIDLGPNPGALHYDPGSERIYVGFGGRKIAVIDSTHNKHWENIRLDGEPGPLALEDQGSRIFIAAGGQPRIIVADRDGNKQTGSWDTGHGEAAAVALDEDGGLLLAAFAHPSALAWFDLASGAAKGQATACASPGDLLSDPDRHRVYLACGEGRIEVFGRDAGGSYARLGAVDTVKGATAALLAPTSGRLYLGVPAEGGRPAEVRIYAPAG